MKTLEERAKSMADWLSHRLPIPKVYNLPKMFADMLTEQREIDEHEHNNSLNALYEMHQKQLAKYDADLKETKRQRDEYYDELLKLRQQKIELIEWLNEEVSRCREYAKTGYDAYEIGSFEGQYMQAEETIDKIKAMEE